MLFMFNQTIPNIYGAQNGTILIIVGVKNLIDGILEVSSTIGGFRTIGSAALAIILLVLLRQRVIPRLHSTLCNQKSTKTLPELKWINKKYVMHMLKNINESQKLEIKASDVLQKIRQKQNYIVGIVGKAGMGKSEILLWLYLKLSKAPYRRCAFIQIGTFSSIESICHSIKKQIDPIKKFIPFYRAYILIDAVDEAVHLFDAQTGFNANFLIELKKDVDIPNCNIIFTIRDECFQGGVKDIVENCRTNTSTPDIFRLLPMNPKQIIDIYKSFRYAKKIEKRLQKKYPNNLRFQNALPNTDIRRSIELFTHYINNHPNTIFQYPLFMRYANSLMEENDGSINLLTLDNSLKAVNILVEKMIKWEYRAIHKQPAYYADGITMKPEYQSFHDSIHKMINQILVEMISDCKIRRTVNRDVVVRAYNSVFSNESREINSPFQVAHCLFSWDAGETVFEFHNLILWDYFASNYLCESSVDYKVRKYIFNYMSENTRLYQSLITVYFQRQYAKLTTKEAKRLFDMVENTKKISIATIPELCLTEFYKMLPFNDWSYVLPTEMAAKRKTINEIVDKYMIVMNETGPRISNSISLDDYYAFPTGATFDAETISEIIGNHRLIIDVNSSSCIHSSADIAKLCTADELKSLTHLAFYALEVDDFDLRPLFDLPNLQYITLPPYHKSFLQLGEINRQNAKKLYLWHRTPYGKAANRFYEGKNTKNDIDLLEIIFELETEDTEYMGLDKREYQSTCWTALSLAEAYRNKAYHLTRDKQYRILSKIKDAINSNWDDKRLNYRYCYDFGRLPVSRSEYDEGIKWLLLPYSKKTSETFVRFNHYDLGCALVKAYTWNMDIEKGVSILADIEQDYQMKEKIDGEYYKTRCALRLRDLKAEYDSITDLKKVKALNALMDFSEISSGYEMIYGRYASEYYLIIGDYEKAKIIIDELSEDLNRTNMRDEYDEIYQGNWIQYHEMFLLYQYLTGDHNKAIQTANALLEHKYRTKNLLNNAYQYIKNKCEANLNPNISIDETLFKSYDHFRRENIWI